LLNLCPVTVDITMLESVIFGVKNGKNAIPDTNNFLNIFRQMAVIALVHTDSYGKLYITKLNSVVPGVSLLLGSAMLVCSRASDFISSV